MAHIHHRVVKAMRLRFCANDNGPGDFFHHNKAFDLAPVVVLATNFKVSGCFSSARQVESIACVFSSRSTEKKRGGIRKLNKRKNTNKQKEPLFERNQYEH